MERGRKAKEGEKKDLFITFLLLFFFLFPRHRISSSFQSNQINNEKVMEMKWKKEECECELEEGTKACSWHSIQMGCFHLVPPRVVEFSWMDVTCDVSYSLNE